MHKQLLIVLFLGICLSSGYLLAQDDMIINKPTYQSNDIVNQLSQRKMAENVEDEQEMILLNRIAETLDQVLIELKKQNTK